MTDRDKQVGSDEPTPVPQAGRPRDAQAGGRIREAALRLVREEGYSHVSISRIAAEAEVARQTIYNRWPTKADLVLDAFFAQADVIATRPDLASAEPRSELLYRFLKAIFAHLEQDGAALRSLIAAAQEDEGFRAIFWSKFVEPRGRIVADLLADAQKHGELDGDRNVELITAFVHGAFWYRLLGGQTLGDPLARDIVSEVFRR